MERQNRDFSNIPPEQYKFDPYTGKPLNPKKNQMTPEDKKIANTLCVLSLVLSVASPLLLSIYHEIMNHFDVLNISEPYDSLMTIFVMCAEVAALVLMIVTRVKYPKHTFGLVLMIIYIVEFTSIIIGWILIMVTCYTLCGQCNGW